MKKVTPLPLWGLTDPNADLLGSWKETEASGAKKGNGSWDICFQLENTGVSKKIEKIILVGTTKRKNGGVPQTPEW